MNLGVGAGTSKSNMVHGLASVDLGKERISSIYSSPDSEDVVLPAIAFERVIVKSGVSASELGGDLVNCFHLDSIFEFHSGNYLGQVAEAT